MTMSKLLQKAIMIYDYIKVKSSIITYMQVKPSQALVEKHVEGLGFAMKDKGKKTCNIMLASKDDNLRQTLMLSYYSMPLSACFIPEGCMALFLSNEQNTVNGAFSVDELYEMLHTHVDLLNDE